jgi:transcriptional regulator with XRE-family HTH domain
MIANLKKIREKAGLTREELAVKMNVSFMRIYRWEKGQKMHKLFERKLREILNIKEIK